MIKSIRTASVVLVFSLTLSACGAVDGLMDSFFGEDPPPAATPVVPAAQDPAAEASEVPDSAGEMAEEGTAEGTSAGPADTLRFDPITDVTDLTDIEVFRLDWSVTDDGVEVATANGAYRDGAFIINVNADEFPAGLVSLGSDGERDLIIGESLEADDPIAIAVSEGLLTASPTWMWETYAGDVSTIGLELVGERIRYGRHMYRYSNGDVDVWIDPQGVVLRVVAETITEDGAVREILFEVNGFNDVSDARVADVFAQGDDELASALARDLLREGLTTFKVFYADNEKYLASVDELTAISPSLTFVERTDALADEPAGTIAFVVSDQTVVLVVADGAGSFWCMADGHDGTKYGKADSADEVNSLNECTDEVFEGEELLEEDATEDADSDTEEESSETEEESDDS